CCFVFFSFYRAPPDLHSFPTRRSSDLRGEADRAAQRLRHRGRTIVARYAAAGRGPAAGAPIPKARDRRDAGPDAARRCGRLDRRSEEHTSELQSLAYLVCRLLLEKKKK